VGIAFSPDGTRLAATSEYGAAKIWNVETGKELFTLSGHTMDSGRLTFSSDGTRLATASDDKTAKVWDVATGQDLLTLTGHTGWVNDVAFSPGGSRLITAGEDGTIKVWNARTGQELFSLYGNTSSVVRIAFSSDCASPPEVAIATPIKKANPCRLLTASEDGTVRSYLVQLEDLVVLAKSRLGRTLTTEECQKYLHMEQCPSKPGS
jgi:WD40 repeat protein